MRVRHNDTGRTGDVIWIARFWSDFWYRRMCLVTWDAGGANTWVRSDHLVRVLAR